MADGLPRKVAEYMAANPPPPFDVWECNRQAFELFEFLVSQWRSSAVGRCGLVYAEAYLRMNELGIRKRPLRLALMDDLRLMEEAVLAEISRRREE